MNQPQTEMVAERRPSCFLTAIVVFLAAVILFTGYRYSVDKNAYDVAISALKTGDFEVAYKNFSELSAGLILMDFAGFREKARQGLLETAKREVETGVFYLDREEFQQAYAIFERLSEHVRTYKIADYAVSASIMLDDSYSRFAKSTEPLYASGDCRGYVEGGLWLLDHLSQTRVALDENGWIEKVERCEGYLALIDDGGNLNPPRTAGEIAAFILAKPDDALSVLASDELLSLIRQHGVENLASAPVCLATSGAAEAPELMEDAEYLFSCGQSLHRVEEDAAAIPLLESFIVNYPKDPRYQQAVDMLTALLISRAEVAGAGDLPRPVETGLGQKGSSMYEVQNDSPYAIRIIFQGPENVIKTIPACPSCKPYPAAPDGCPIEGPEEKFSVLPGDYVVLVETVVNDNVVPYAGRFLLEDGQIYSECFFIVSAQP